MKIYMKSCLIHWVDHWQFESPLLKHGLRQWTGPQKWNVGPGELNSSARWKLYLHLS